MSLNKKILLWIPIAALALAGCTVKESPRSPSAKQTVPPPPGIEKGLSLGTSVSSLQDFPSADLVQINKFDLKSIGHSIHRTQSSKTLLQNLSQLQNFVLNPNYFTDPKVDHSSKLHEMLSDYNEGFLKLFNMDPKAVYSHNLLKKYHLAVSYGCMPDFSGCPDTYSFFKSDYNSAQIVLLMAKAVDQEVESKEVTHDGVKQCGPSCLKLMPTYYHLLRWDLALRNYVQDPQTDFLYLKHAWDYADYLHELPSSPETERQLAEHGSIFEKILQNYRGNANDSAFMDFIKQAHVFQYSKLTPDPFPYGRKTLFKIAAMHYLYVPGSQPHRLNPDVIRAIQKSQSTPDQLGESFTQMVNRLAKTQPLILKALHLDPSKVDDPSFIDTEYFLMVDRLYRGQWSKSDVDQIWRASDQNEGKLLTTLNYYLRMEVVNMLADTNNFMSAIYARKEDFTPSNIVTKALQNSEPVSDRWMVMLSRSKILGDFLESEFASSQGKALSEYQKSKEMIDGLSRNIKYLSVYPNMMSLVYFMADLNGKLPVTTWWGQTFEIDSKTIIDNFFEGNLNPWFRFGDPNDNSGLNKYDIVYAFYFALNTGLFESFANTKGTNGKPLMDRESFFNKTMGVYLIDEKNYLNRQLRNLETHENSDQNFASFVSMCQQLASAPNSKQPLLYLTLDDVHRLTFAGDGDAGLSNSAEQLYGGDQFSPTSVLDDIQQNLEPRLILIKSMVSMMDYNLVNFEKIGAVDQTQAKAIAEMLKRIHANVNEVEQIARQYYDQAYAENSEISSCLTQAENIENQHESELYQMEVQHLSDVYGAIQSLQGIQDPAKLKAKTDAINKHFEDTYGLPNEEDVNPENRNLDWISKSGYQFSEYDLLLRMKWRMEQKLVPAVQVTMPSDPTRLSFYNDNPTELPIFSSDTHQMLTRAQFVESGMKLLNGQSGSYIQWINNNYGLEPRLQQLDSQVALYKLGYILNVPRKERISAQSLIDASEGLYKFIALSAGDIQTMKWLDVDQKVRMKELQPFLIRGQADKPVLDHVGDLINNDNGSLKEAQNYFDAQNSLLNFLFTPDKEVQVSLRSNYLPLVASTEAIAHDFYKQVDKDEQPSQASTQIANLGSWTIPYALAQEGNKQVVQYYTIDKSFDGSPVLISTSTRWNFSSKLDDFDRNTKNYFALKSTDPECQGSHRNPYCPTVTTGAH